MLFSLHVARRDLLGKDRRGRVMEMPPVDILYCFCWLWVVGVGGNSVSLSSLVFVVLMR